jgi:hypothetical protein
VRGRTATIVEHPAAGAPRLVSAWTAGWIKYDERTKGRTLYWFDRIS